MPDATPQAAAHLHFRLPPEPPRLLRARERIRDYLQQHCSDQRVIDEAVLAVEEACTNAIRHSRCGDAIDISIGFHGTTLVAEVKDEGCGFDVAAFDPEAVPDAGKAGGRGLFLMAKLTDQMSLCCDDGLRVRLVKTAVARRSQLALDAGIGDLATGERGRRDTRVRSLLEEIDEAFIALDWEYRYLHANELALTMARKPVEEVIGRRPWELFPGFAESAAGVACRAAMELGKPSVVEYNSVVSGTWLEARVYPTASGVCAYFRDVSARKRVEREHDRLLERLEIAQRAAGAGTWDWDVATGHIEWSPESHELFGLDQGATTAPFDSWSAVLHPEDLEAAKAQIGRALRDHAALDGEYRIVRPDGRALWVNALGRGFYDDQGEPVRMTGICVDITGRKRAEEERQHLVAELQARTEELQTQSEKLQNHAWELARRTYLAEALNATNRLVHSTLDFDQILQRALDSGVQALGVDAGAIEMREESFWVVRHLSGFPAGQTGLRLSERQAPIATLAMSSLEPLTISDTMDEPGVNVGFVRRHQLRSVLAVPLIVRRTVLGCLLFYGKAARSFSEAEIDFGRKLGATVALALENARLYAAQRNVAQTLQENFIHELPAIEGIELAAASAAAHQPDLVGGDFRDVFQLPNGLVIALVGDVMGKGIKAAGYTERVRSAIRAFAHVSPAPEFILTSTNRLLMRQTERPLLVSAIVVMLDPETGRVFMASAGHPPAIRVTAGGSALLELTYGTPLGAVDVIYQASESTLDPGETLVLYTDGVTDARREGTFFGEGRLLEVLEQAPDGHPQTLVDHLHEAVTAFAGELRDDVQILALRRTR